MAQARRDLTVTNLPGPDGRLREFFVLFSRTNENVVAEVLADHDLMRAYIQYRRQNPAFVVTASELAGMLAHAGVTDAADPVGLQILAEWLNGDRPPEGPVQVARARPPERGADGRVEFHVQPTSREARYDPGGDGTIDYRELNLIENCFEGQLVATLHPPRQGQPGVNLLGEAVPAEAGAPFSVLAGPGVALSPNGLAVHATMEGRLVYENGLLSVSDEYEVRGDVDYRVGNIDFVGSVTVRGAVMDGFRVRSHKDLKVTGVVGACELRSGGKMELLSGVKGKGDARLRCGELSARYLDECTVEAQGDVKVEREIVNCRVSAGGAVRLPPLATLVGGETMAFGGLETGTLGAPAATATRVSVGFDWRDEDRLRRMEGTLDDLARRAQAAWQLMAPLLEEDRRTRLTMEQKSALADLGAELRKFREQFARLAEARDEILERRNPGQVPPANVTGWAHRGVEILVPNGRLALDKDERGPLSFVSQPPPQGGRRRLVKRIPLKPLAAAPPPEPEVIDLPEPVAAPDEAPAPDTRAAQAVPDTPAAPAVSAAPAGTGAPADDEIDAILRAATGGA